MSEYKTNLVIIIPSFNEAECIEDFIKEVDRVNKDFQGFPRYCFLFVDDGSNDDTFNILQQQSKKDKRVKYISFSRNFGKEAAIYAGLKTAYENLSCEYYVLMDADLQDPPALLPEMFSTITSENIERVATRRCSRKGEPPIRSFFARLFYKLMNNFSQVQLVDGARDYQLMSSKYVEAVLRCCEYNRFFKGLSQWVGFKTKWIEYENIERVKGETKWSFWGLLWYSIEGIVAFSTWPLRVISINGFILSFLSIVALIVVIIRAITFGDPVAGWPSLVCILLLLGGLILTCLGILGLYFEKAYLEIKHRPVYIVDKKQI